MPAAVIGPIVGGALAAGGAVIASSNNSSAIKNSTNAQVDAQNQALAAQQQEFNQSLAAQQQALNASLGLQTSALNQNAALQTGAYNSSGQQQAAIYNQNVNRLNPFVQTGYAAMNGINGILGLPKQAAYQPKAVSFTPISAPTITAPTVTPTDNGQTVDPVMGQLRNPDGTLIPNPTGTGQANSGFTQNGVDYQYVAGQGYVPSSSVFTANPGAPAASQALVSALSG